MRLMALSTSRWPGRQLRQLLRELETALATCVRRCWFSGLLGSCMARLASSSSRWDFSMTSRALSITASCTWRSVVVAATPRTAFVSTYNIRAIIHCSPECKQTQLKSRLHQQCTKTLVHGWHSLHTHTYTKERFPHLTSQRSLSFITRNFPISNFSNPRFQLHSCTELPKHC